MEANTVSNNLQPVDEHQLVIFRLGKEQYGLPITKVQDINRMMPITKMPHAPDFMEGIINLRGQIIPVIDLRKRFLLSAPDYTSETRIIIVQANQELVGIIVDSVAEVARISSKDIEPPPATFSSEIKYIQGIGKRKNSLITLLNIDLIMTSRETIEMQQISQS